jgi:hypothetical protein
MTTLFEEPPRMPSPGRQARPRRWLVVVALSILVLAVQLLRATPIGPALNRWLAVMSNSLYIYVLMRFFPQVWQNRSDDKTPIVLVMLVWVTLAWQTWLVLIGRDRSGYWGQGMRLHFGPTPVRWLLYDPFQSLWRCGAAVAMAACCGWLVGSLPHYWKRRNKGTGPLLVVGAATITLSAGVWALVN